MRINQQVHAWHFSVLVRMVIVSKAMYCSFIISPMKRVVWAKELTIKRRLSVFPTGMSSYLRKLQRISGSFKSQGKNQQLVAWGKCASDLTPHVLLENHQVHSLEIAP